MKIGCHVSISGGIDKSIDRARLIDINTMQIFSKNSLTWKERILSEHEIFLFRKKIVQANILPVFVHASYLINLASPDEIIFQRSIHAFLEEMKRTNQLLEGLSVPYVIIHPGSHRGEGNKKGLQKMISALNQILHESSFLKLETMILLENTSGSGTNLGHTFNQLSQIIEKIKNKDKIGICLDTCHAFASGYNLAEQSGIEELVKNLERNDMLDKLKILHVNDSKYPLGSKKDRHMHIGKGFIGLDGFKYLLNHPALRHLPCILETPKQNFQDDQKNIQMIRKIKKES